MASVSALYGVSAAKIERGLPLAAARARADPEDPIGALPDAMAAELETRHDAPARIHYFHGTRAWSLDSFRSEGLRPLAQMIDVLWQDVGELVPELSGRELCSLRADLGAGNVGPHTYGCRITDREQPGPCGHLLRDPVSASA
jgi:hypothetical protein